MSKKHEERARALHTRLTNSMRTQGGTGRKKYMTAEVDSLGVSVDSKGAMTVTFTYEDGTVSEIDFAPEATIYDMTREARRHATGRCSEIRAAREAGRPAVALQQADPDALDALHRAIDEDLKKPPVVTAAREAAEREALKARITEALLQHRADAPISAVRDGKPSGLISCLGCGLEAHKPDGANMGSVDADLLRAFAEHQADVVIDLL